EHASGGTDGKASARTEQSPVLALASQVWGRRSFRRRGRESVHLVQVEQVDPDVPVACQRTNNGPQRLGGTAVATNDLPEIVRVDPDFEYLALTNPAGPHVNVVGILYDPLDEVLKRLFQHVRPRPRTSPRSSRPTSPRPSWTFRPCSRCPAGR